MLKSSRSFLFPDVNVWIALTYDQHVHHSSAARWFAQLSDDADICFCRITQLSLLRLLTTKAVMSTEVLNRVEAWQVYDRWLEDPRVVFLDEPAGFEQTFRAQSRQHGPAPKEWADSYLVAFASLCGLRIVTFDRALRGRNSGALLLTS